MRKFLNTARTGKTRVWQVDAVGDQLITEYGELGGAMQRVSDTAYALNVGKANEKSAEQVATEMMERQILLKTRAGYVEDGVEHVAATSIDFDALPINLRFYKPDNSMSALMEKKLEESRAFAFRKRDGEAFIACVGTTGAITLYSRTMLVEHDKEPGVLWGERFPQIMADLEEANLPPCTILLGELVMDRDGQDDYKHVTRVMKSLKIKALQVQEDEGWLSYYIWDVPFWAGEDLVSSTPIMGGEGSRFWKALTTASNKEFLLGPHCQSACGWGEFLTDSIKKTAMDFARAAGWEGYVVIDAFAEGYGDKSYNFRGKTDRPGKFCAKLKPVCEQDFIAYWDPNSGIGEYGKGKNQGLIGSVQLYQYDSLGERHYISECGNGFSDADLKALSDPALYPLVFEVRYDERTYVSQGDATNALRFPRLLRVRHDKGVSECVNPLLDAKEA